MELLMMADLLPPSDTFSASSSPRRPLLSPSDDSEFDFGRHLPPNLTLPAADELFSGGVIRPLHPHPSLIPTPKPTTTTTQDPNPNPNPNPKPPPRHRSSRSLSPLRVSEFALHQSSKSSSVSSSSSSSSSLSPSKWRLKDFLLFRSASEGRERRTKSIDPIKKSSSVSSALFACIGTSYDNDSSFRYAIGEGEDSSRTRQLRYYRAIEEAKKNGKTTSLQYKQRLLDCVGLNSSSSNDGDRRLGHCFSL